jgi:hypothetical protein
MISDASRAALDQAAAIAEWFGATMAAVHVYPAAPVIAMARRITPSWTSRISRAAMAS